MKKNRQLRAILILATLLLLPIAGCANDKKSDGQHQRPPPEAIKACEGKTTGDLVQFVGRKGKQVKATCQDMQGQLVAVPKDRGPKGQPQ